MARNKQRHYNKQQRRQNQQQNESNHHHSHGGGGRKFGSQSKSLPDYYATLGVERTADVGEIKSAFRRLAKIYHPDKLDPNSTSDRQRAKSADMFRQVNEAYNVLVDDDQRRQYDAASSYGNDESDDNFYYNNNNEEDEAEYCPRHRRRRDGDDDDDEEASDSGRGSGAFSRGSSHHHTHFFYPGSNGSGGRRFQFNYSFYPQKESSFSRLIREYRWMIHLGLCLLIAILFTMLIVRIGVVPFLMNLLYEIAAFLLGYVVYFTVYLLAYLAVFAGGFYVPHRILLYYCAFYRDLLGFRLVYTME